MLRIYSRIQTALMSDRGAAAVEYGLLVALIALIMAIGAGILGGQLNVLFTDIAEALGYAAPATP